MNRSSNATFLGAAGCRGEVLPALGDPSARPTAALGGDMEAMFSCLSICCKNETLQQSSIRRIDRLLRLICEMWSVSRTSGGYV